MKKLKKKVISKLYDLNKIKKVLYFLKNNNFLCENQLKNVSFKSCLEFKSNYIILSDMI